jgi:putative ABC transport system permease protein
MTDLVLRLPATGLIPSGSLFVTENYTASLRLACNRVVGAAEGGNISMKNEHIVPLNLFVNRSELCEALEIEGKINLILTDKEITNPDFNQAWTYSSSGLSVCRRDSLAEVTSDRIFLQEEVTNAIVHSHKEANRLFSYLANSIETDERAVPYSFITALDRFGQEALQKEDIILSDYTANRLQAKPGDTVRVSYFTSHDLKTLVGQTIGLRVKRIVPLADLLGDKTLSARFPGLSDMESCTDWNSDLPIDMSLITDEDEAYWALYRQTPKAIVACDAVAPDWSSAYGNATAIRITGAVDLSGLCPEMFGIQLIHPRETGLYAARNGVDFSGLFLALGFFIILSAMLLALIPLSEMIWRRRQETALLKALGFTGKKIAGILWRESAPVVFISSGLGVIAGLLYASLIMWLLGNVWTGATHTGGFGLYPGIPALLAGLLAGAGLFSGLSRLVITRAIKEKKPGRLKPGVSLPKKKARIVCASFLSVAIIGTGIFLARSVLLFAGAGVVLIVTAALWGDYLISCRGRLARPGKFRADTLLWSALYAGRKQAALSFFALASGVFVVFSVGLNRKGFTDGAQLRAGTGGYSLWGESSVPLYHNMASQAGREKLSLTGLPADAEVMQCLRYGADDASCLNLNKATAPSVLGVDIDALLSSDFQIERRLPASGRVTVSGQMKERNGNVYPALVDATVLTWSLGLNLGDTLRYKDDRGQNAGIRLIGTLSNSIFQGHILIDRTNFSRIWENTTGSEVFLLKVNDSAKEEVKTLLSQALHEYGVSVSDTSERLKQFNTVTDTYQTIFLTLGGLGLLLGIISFSVVVQKNLVMRHKEIDLYRTLGFANHKIERLLTKENLLVPLYAIITGIISSALGASVGMINVSAWIWLSAFLFAILFIGYALFFVRKSVKKITK